MAKPSPTPCMNTPGIMRKAKGTEREKGANGAERVQEAEGCKRRKGARDAALAKNGVGIALKGRKGAERV